MTANEANQVIDGCRAILEDLYLELNEEQIAQIDKAFTQYAYVMSTLLEATIMENNLLKNNQD